VAGKGRAEANDIELERELRQDVYAFGFYSLLRKLECNNPEKPGFGRSVKPAEDVIRLGQEPSMVFPASTLASYTQGEAGSKPKLDVLFYGLFGPNGPLPLHLTDYARARLKQHDDPTFSQFCDIFHHRLLSLFYRAWASAEPTVSFDRPESDRFGDYIASLSGYGMSSLRNRDAMPDLTKLHFTGRLAPHAKSAEGLVAIIRDFFKVDASIRQYIGEWLELPMQYRCRLGESPTTGMLGENVTIGSRVFECQHKFRILLGPVELKAYELMLPGGESLKRLISVLRNYVGDELKWDVNLILRHKEVPRIKLGEYGRLGWTTWLGDRKSEQDADDLMLVPMNWA